MTGCLQGYPQVFHNFVVNGGEAVGCSLNLIRTRTPRLVDENDTDMLYDERGFTVDVKKPAGPANPTRAMSLLTYRLRG